MTVNRLPGNQDKEMTSSVASRDVLLSAKCRCTHTEALSDEEELLTVVLCDVIMTREPHYEPRADLTKERHHVMQLAPGEVFLSRQGR